MPIYETFSHRRRKAQLSGVPDVYEYDSFPPGLKVQLHQILSDALGGYADSSGFGSDRTNSGVWNHIQKILAREKQRHSLAGSPSNSKRDILEYLKNEDGEDVVDLLEICCRVIGGHLTTFQKYELESAGVVQMPGDALVEINYRLREAGVGYQYVEPDFVRVDSEFLHEEVVKPALALLRDARFSGAQDEFLQAHRHYRTGNAKDAVHWANKAFESTMKTVCDLKGWAPPKGARASDLVKLCKANGLWPDYLDASFDQLISTLKSGLPEVRNNVAGHGQGAHPVAAPDYVAAYAIHLAAAKIKFIADAASADAA